MENFEQIEKIEQYLEGSLKGEELGNFEQAMAQDPSLQNEVALQKTIQNELAKSRTTELKARLNNITVSTIDPYRGAKIAAGVIAGAVITGLIGYQVGNSGDIAVQEEVIFETQSNTSPQEENTVTYNEVVASTETETTSDDVIFEEESTETTTTTVEESTTAKPKKEVADKGPSLPNFNDTYIPEDDSDPHLSEENELPSGGFSNNIDTKVAGDIVVEFESGKSLQYKFDGPKVFLYGIDKNITKPVFYDVYMSGKKTTYMKYENNFYSLDRSISKKTDLLEEKDASIIKELKLRYKD